MTTLEILRAARALISEPEHWTQMANARDSTGNAVASDSIHAVSWCSLGAVWAQQFDMSTSLGFEAEAWLSDTVDRQPVSEFNDNNSHTSVLDMFDKTIARLEAAA